MTRVQPVGSNGTDVRSAILKLESLSEVIINQHLMNFEVRGYKFSICDADNNQFMEAREQLDDSSWCWRLCCSRTRPLQMIIYDNEHKTVMELKRPYRCECSLLWCCCLQLMTMKSPLGMIFGTAKQEVNITPTFAVMDATSKIVCKFVKDNSGGFKILGEDGHGELGRIHNLSSLLQEENRHVNSNKFKITFASDMNVMKKALVLASSLLVDFNYLDKSSIIICENKNDLNMKKTVFRNCKYYRTGYDTEGKFIKTVSTLF